MLQSLFNNNLDSFVGMKILLIYYCLDDDHSFIIFLPNNVIGICHLIMNC